MKNENGCDLSGRELTLWTMLERDKVVIPIIQRDYAQGRTGKEYLRHRLLESVFRALDPNSESRRPVKLDFVYGTEERDSRTGNPCWVVHPLDGQQRLTTLWLVHWYLAMRSKKTDEAEVRERLIRFSYETRASSRDFCCQLVERAADIRSAIETGDTVADAIRYQTWFELGWKDDPTVDGMIRTLNGTDIGDGRPSNCLDGIAQWFGTWNEEQSKAAWEKLASTDCCPISFYYQSLRNLRDPDALYIKMNARGKPLTPFENFKAELDEFCRKRADEIQTAGDDCLAGRWRDVPRKLDNEWNDLFWTPPREGVAVSGDDRYLAFFNRLVFTDIVTRKSDGGYVQRADVPGLTDKTAGTNDFYRFFEGRCVYETFKGYEPTFSELSRFSAVFDHLSQLHKAGLDVDDEVQTLAPVWFVGPDRPGQARSWVRRFRFLPDTASFTASGDFSPGLHDAITQQGRAWFAAICRFVENVPLPLYGDGDEAKENAIGKWRGKFRNWLRVSANLVENAGIETLSGTIATVRLLHELSPHAGDILGFLSGPDTSSFRSGAVAEQVAEEMDKAAFLVGRAADPNAASLLESAEAFPCCRGWIGFLYRDAAGRPDWDNFGARFGEIKRWIDAESGKSRDGAFAALVSHWSESVLLENGYRGVSFCRKAESWKANVFKPMSRSYATPLDRFLLNVEEQGEDELLGKLRTGLGEIEMYWSDGRTWRILVGWRCTMIDEATGREETRLHRVVLTDYARRMNPPDNGLFADLDWSEEKIVSTVRNYAERRGVRSVVE